MSEQDKQGQPETAGSNDDALTGETKDNVSSQSGQGKQEKSNSSGNSPEQTGEGTGAKAGEYS